MPVIVTALLASPRMAKPGPVTTGVRRDDVGHPLDLVADLLPLVDRTQALRPRLDQRGDRPVAGSALWPGNFLGVG